MEGLESLCSGDNEEVQLNDTDKDEENVNTVEDGENQKVDKEDEEEDEKEIEEEREAKEPLVVAPGRLAGILMGGYPTCI